MPSQADAARRLLEAFNANRPDDAADLITDDFLDHHVPPEIPRGVEGLRTWWTILHSAFEGRIDVDDVIEGDDRVASRWRFSGTHIGEFNGIPATNAKFSAEFMSIDRFEGGASPNAGRLETCWDSCSKLAPFRADHSDRCRRLRGMSAVGSPRSTRAARQLGAQSRVAKHDHPHGHHQMLWLMS